MKNKRLNREAEGISSIVDDLIREIEELEINLENSQERIEELEKQVDALRDV